MKKRESSIAKNSEKMKAGKRTTSQPPSLTSAQPTIRQSTLTTGTMIMNEDKNNIIAFPLPVKLIAKSGAEMKEKVKDLSKFHDCFGVTLAKQNNNGVFESYLMR